ncbi:hypothetical protein DM867_12625 [Halosegnis rubeus]|uniref:Uncharacterized protein n=1 Tax=Halosegnis rubeus TaxID=2212850 RepID=A0A5N5U2D6_9EURY|nr:DUF6149 family protein [Halosegnis rubeus]KAB7512579.1 hypothetical protein DM867_12625 [Halosegnis rubeus]
MRLYQTWKNYVAQVALEREIPVVSALRHNRLDALFDRTIDTYTAALEAGYPAADARESTHIVAACAFMNQGWGLLEIPPVETDEIRLRCEETTSRLGATATDG